MGASSHLVVFSLDEQRFALPVSVVERVVRAVEVLSLPGVPPAVTGVINVHGQIIPVVNLRRRCGLPERGIDADDHFIIAHTSGRTIALPVDSTQVIRSTVEECIATDQVVPDCEFVDQVVKGPDGMILVFNIDALLSHEEHQVLRTLVGAAGGPV
jgi:purine-binding chemotaxis protein CheW